MLKHEEREKTKLPGLKQTVVTDNCNGKYLPQPPDLNSTTHKEKKTEPRGKCASSRQNHRGSGSQEELDNIRISTFLCMTRVGYHLTANNICLGCMQMSSLKYPIWSLSYRVCAVAKDWSVRSITPTMRASAFCKSPGRGSKEAKEIYRCLSCELCNSNLKRSHF